MNRKGEARTTENTITPRWVGGEKLVGGTGKLEKTGKRDMTGNRTTFRKSKKNPSEPKESARKRRGWVGAQENLGKGHQKKRRGIREKKKEPGVQRVSNRSGGNHGKKKKRAESGETSETGTPEAQAKNNAPKSRPTIRKKERRNFSLPWYSRGEKVWGGGFGGEHEKKKKKLLVGPDRATQGGEEKN